MYWTKSLIYKYKDINDLMKYVPPMYHDFYNNIPHEARVKPGPEITDDVIEQDADGASDIEWQRWPQWKS